MAQRRRRAAGTRIDRATAGGLVRELVAWNDAPGRDPARCPQAWRDLVAAIDRGDEVVFPDLSEVFGPDAVPRGADPASGPWVLGTDDVLRYWAEGAPKPGPGKGGTTST